MQRIRFSVLLVFVMCAIPAFSTTFYIDYVNGSDSNSGTSTSSPWKRHPFMVGFSGTYNHSAGDQFIFKGGVTWPVSCFGMTIASGGNSSAYDYYGVNKSWYSGSSWTQPTFDGGGAPTVVTVFMWIPTGDASYVVIDNIHMTDFYWDSTASYGLSYISVGGNNYIIIQNCNFNGWTHSSDAVDQLDVILGGTAYANTGCVISNCVFDGTASGGNSGAAVYCMPAIINSIVTNCSNGLMVNGSPAQVSGCIIGPINLSYTGTTDHPNSIETEGSSAGLIYVHHNIIFGAIGETIGIGSPGGPAYIYDNLIYNTTPVPILASGVSESSSMWIYNNTVVSTGAGSAFRCVGDAWTLVAENNHFIDGDNGGGFGTVTEQNNLDQSSAQASSAGYTQANSWEPISASEPTVGGGLNLTSLSLPGFGTDLLGHVRPATGAWDIGAFQFTTNGSSSPPPSSNQPPVVSAISQNIADVDPNTAGIQVYAGTTVQYSATATSPNSGVTNTYQWTYTVNGGSAVVFQSGSGTVPTITFTYPTNSVGNSYVWTLTVNSGTLSASSQLTVSVEAQPVVTTGLSFSATSGVITAPFIVTNGYIYQPSTTTIASSGISSCGMATYTFNITNAGNYVVQCLVLATNEGMDSFYVNIDSVPTDPYMIWKIVPVTVGFQEEVVSWQGTGAWNAPEFAPEVFNLSAGTHQLIIVGREQNAELQSISILQMVAPPQNLQVLPTIVNSPTFPLSGQ